MKHCEHTELVAQAAEVCVTSCMQTVPGGKALEALRRADRAWQDLCSAGTPAQPPTVIRETSAPLPACADAYDVVVLGGARAQACWQSTLLWGKAIREATACATVLSLKAFLVAGTPGEFC